MPWQDQRAGFWGPGWVPVLPLSRMGCILVGLQFNFLAPPPPSLEEGSLLGGILLLKIQGPAERQCQMLTPPATLRRSKESEKAGEMFLLVLLYCGSTSPNCFLKLGMVPGTGCS